MIKSDSSIEISLTVEKLLREQIEETRRKLPFSLKVIHLKDLLGIGETKVYEALQKDVIPGARKINHSWRVPRDVFLAWWYGYKLCKDDIDFILDK